MATPLPPVELLIDAAPDGVLVVDDRGRIAAVNERLLTMLRRPRAELLGAPLELILHPERRGAHSQASRSWLSHPHSLAPVVGEVWRGDDTTAPVEIAISSLRHEGHTWAIAHLRETTERRRIDAHLVFLTLHDALTGVGNRAAFDDALARLSRQGPWPVGVVMVDLDGLKGINDELGHEAGDRQLRAAATVLRRVFRASDLVARIGGDEFAVLASGSSEVAMAAFEQRLEAARQDFNHAHHPPLRWSIGTAVALETGGIGAALQRADAAMYVEKARHHRSSRQDSGQ